MVEELTYLDLHCFWCRTGDIGRKWPEWAPEESWGLSPRVQWSCQTSWQASSKLANERTWRTVQIFYKETKQSFVPLAIQKWMTITTCIWVDKQKFKKIVFKIKNAKKKEILELNELPTTLKFYKNRRSEASHSLRYNTYIARQTNRQNKWKPMKKSSILF